MSAPDILTKEERAAISARASAATPGPWAHVSYESGTEYVHMRKASGKAGPAIMGPDHSDQDGHVGAHMNLYNVPAFQALTGESEESLVREKWANAEFIANARVDVVRLLGAVDGLEKAVEQAVKDVVEARRLHALSMDDCHRLVLERDGLLREVAGLKAELDVLRKGR